MGFRSNGRLMSGVSVLTLATLFVTPVFGQDQQAEASGTTVLKPIVVTGEKVARDMKNTASSVSVKSAEEIRKEETGSPTVSDAIKDIPNVVYTDNVAGSSPSCPKQKCLFYLIVVALPHVVWCVK